MLAAYKRLGNKAAVARELGLARSTVVEHVQNSGDDQVQKVGGRVEVFEYEHRPLPPKGKVKRYIVTSAQNNTKIHTRLWENLLALAKHYKAEILVSRYTYNRNAHNEKPGRARSKEGDAYTYDPRIAPYVCDHRVMLAPDLAFAGELNILPTAHRPLSGLETYTGTYSMIVPHAKLAMQSVPALGIQPKFCYTTGSVTLRNYIAKKAGQRAEFHHAYAALLVEVDGDGDWFVRQLNGTDRGYIQDLDVAVVEGKIIHGDVESVGWGDIHVAQLDSDIRALIWGKDGVLDALRPRTQFFHDLHDHRYRNHHDTDNPHKMFAYHCAGKESVAEELRAAADFLRSAERKWCKSVVVDSNHDAALMKWLRVADYRKDPVNAVFFLEAQLSVYLSLARDEGIHLLHWALRRFGCSDQVRFLRQDESCLIAGIEHGMHGHLGPNGLRGSPQALVRLGTKANTGHTHSAGILDGLYTAGVTGRLRMGYNSGPSSWSRSHIVTYANGKRAIITMRGVKWRADDQRKKESRTRRPAGKKARNSRGSI